MKGEKGKIFGKFNIIDLLVVLLIVAVAVALVFRGKFLNPLMSNPDNYRIEYVVKVTRIDPEVYENAKARIDSGETQLVAGDTLIDGNVVGIRAVPYTTTVVTDEGKYTLAEDPYYLTAYITVQAAVSNPVTQLVVSQETRVGNSNCVKTMGAQFIGVVISVTPIS